MANESDTRPAQDPNPKWNLHAVVAGWLVPGLGHIILGIKRRGIILMITISAVWFAGISIGGISVIDSRQSPAEGPFDYETMRDRIFSDAYTDALNDLVSVDNEPTREQKEKAHQMALAATPELVRKNARENIKKKRRFSAWFLGQMLIAASLPVDWYVHKQQIKYAGYHPAVSEENPGYQPSYGRINEQGILYTALAGLLNLLALLDVLYCDPKYRRERDQRSAPDEEAEVSAAVAASH